MTRTLRPRATDNILVAPIAMTDRTCHALAGQDPKPWRALVIKLGIPHVIQGKRMIVLVADYVAAIERASRTARTNEPTADAEPTEPSVDALLARLGRSRAA